MKDGKPVILYIDDDQDFLDGMRVILEANGYVMVEALTAEDGLKVFRDEQPDLVLVDLMMEEVDAGTSMITQLRARGCDVPIYMLSSVGDDLAMSTDYSGLGLAGVFQKPIDPNALITILRARLA